MTILADHEIAALARAGMIQPFEPAQVRERDGERCISFGLSSYGYDARLGSAFKVFTPDRGGILDVKAPDPGCWRDHEGETCIVPPGGYVLGHTIETFDLPRDVLALCLGKSSYARVGLIVNTTPIEPGWRGQVTLEIANATPLPARIYAGEGIAQLLFLRGSECAVSYADRGGKYQDQRGVTPARV